MRCGVQSKLWVKNACAIGLSAGFIEPLQSNGLQSIYQFLFNLITSLSIFGKTLCQILNVN